jgi:predicted DNA binding protein
MSIIVKSYIQHERLALAPTLRKLDDIEINVVTQVNTNPGTTVFPFLIKYHDREELENVIGDDLTVKRYDLVDWTDGRGIYYIEHTPETKLISAVVTDVNGFLMHTETKGEGWLVRLLLPDREALNTIWKFSNENNITLDILEIYRNDNGGTEMTYGLTDEQKASLKIAYEKGYFSEPRNGSLSEIADELELSTTAMSGRLRRGTRNLIAATIAEDNDEK